MDFGNQMTSETNEVTAAATETKAQKRSLIPMVRKGAFYLALLLAAVMTVLFLPDLLMLLGLGWTASVGAELGIHRLHGMGVATVIAVFLLGLFAQAYRPTSRVASMWGAFLTILVICIGTVGYGVGRPEEVLSFLLVAGIALIAHPAGRGLLRRGDSFSPALLALVVIAAVPLVAFMVNQFGLSANALDPHASEGHYVAMAGLAFAPIAYGAFAAFGFVGWRLASWLAAIPMAYYGLMSVSFTAQAGSTGTMWGIAAIVWALAFVAVAEYSRVSSSTTLRREVAGEPS